mmetsp:Transcript_35543/g.49338  ORF Transcript_35543/g.49338 Transcript_35543/m.49338 type:complete len:173 (+) Transcript_35543:173-691(+)
MYSVNNAALSKLKFYPRTNQSLCTTALSQGCGACFRPSRAIDSICFLQSIPREIQTSEQIKDGMRFDKTVGMTALKSRKLVGGGSQPLSTSSKKTSKKVTTMGLPVPIVGFFFNPLTALVLYAYGATKFWMGYNRTIYSASILARVALTALWPVLIIASQTYRQNFKKVVWK